MLWCAIMKRLLRQRQATEAAEARKLRLLKMAAAAVTEMEEMTKRRLEAEMETMALEDRRSQKVRAS